MAIFNASLKAGQTPNGVFTGFCETPADITDPATDVWAAGSVLVCLNTDGDNVPTVYVKLPDGTWNEVAQ